MKFYKRTVLYLLILCILITGVACSNSSESVDSDIEVQKNSEHKSSNSKNYTSNKLSLDAENLTFFQHAHPITETENGYFILLDSILHYMDKETKTFVVFSNDSISPEEINNDLRIFLKTDNGRSYSHEAYFPGACSIFYHNEKLYTLEKIYGPKDDRNLIEIDPSTHERKILAKFRTGTGQFVILENKIFLLDQSLYFSTDDENDLLVKYKITGYDLETNQVIDPIEVPIPDGVSLYRQTEPDIVGFKDKMHISISYSQPFDEQGKAIKLDDESVYDKSMTFSFDINTGKLDQLDHGEFNIRSDSEKRNFESELIGRINYHGENSYVHRFIVKFDEKEKTLKNYKQWVNVKKIGSEKEELFTETQAEEFVTSNGKNIYLVPVLHMVGNNGADNSLNNEKIIKKFDGEKWQDLASIKMSDFNTKLSPSNIAIASNDDILIYGDGILYIIKDNKLTEVINYFEME